MAGFHHLASSEPCLSTRLPAMGRNISPATESCTILTNGYGPICFLNGIFETRSQTPTSAAAFDGNRPIT